MGKTEFLDEIVLGDCLDLFREVEDNSVRTIHTSPPYNIERGYEGYHDNLEGRDYLDFIRKVLSECKRTLVPGGALFWQTGYTREEGQYITPLDHLTFNVFREMGFRLKDRIIWRYWGGMAFKSKFTNKHETILWWVKPGQRTTKSRFDVFPVREATKFYDSRNNLFGRNPGNVWEVDRVAFGSNDQTSHIAVFPEEISERIVLATTHENDLVLDPFSGSGTVCKVAKAHGRHFLGFEVSDLYHSEAARRISLQARGEFLSVLSAILKQHVFDTGNTMKVNTIVEKAMSILHPLSLKPYEKMIEKPYLDALCEGREDGVKKSDKIALWKDLEEILPPVASGGNGRDPAGIISLIDRAYLQVYKLHSVYSSAMRFHLAAGWLESLRRALAPRKKEAWRDVLRCLVKSETGTYCLDHDRITIIARDNKVKLETVDQSSKRDSQREPAVPTLF